MISIPLLVLDRVDISTVCGLAMASIINPKAKIRKINKMGLSFVSKELCLPKPARDEIFKLA
jgi:hypothetical protein